MSLHSKMNGIVSRRGFLKGTSGAAVSIALVGCAGAKTQESSTSSNSASKLAIIHTNDSHGHDLLDDESLGLAAVAQLKTDWKAKGYEVLLMDAGDATQGNNLVNCSEGDTAISFMNDVGYDVMALGNHEFDYGQDKIADYVKAATFPILSANTIVDDTGETLVDSSCVFTLKDGRKVGVFGLTTPETSTKASPLLVQGLSFK